MRLMEVGNQPIARGAVFRFAPNADGYGDWLDLMLFRDGDTLGVLIATGPKAGHVLCVLPADALLPNTIMTTGTWLSDNWAKWIWPTADVGNVEYIGRYSDPAGGGGSPT
jgi:hypothetical protein